MPDRRDQPADRETVATRPHDHDQGRQEAALSSRGHHGSGAGRRGRSRTGTCRKKSGCGSRTCAGPGCGRSRSRRAAARRRSAGSCAGTGIRAAASTGRSPCTSWPSGGGPGRGRARSPVMRCCGSSWPSGWPSGGARSRSAARCAPKFPGDPARHVVHETIYQAVYHLSSAGCPASCRPGERRSNGITTVTMIDQRPAEAAGRQEPGHWEGDLITGASNRSAIGSLVDRASRYTVLLHLPGRHTAEAVRDALITAFCQLPPPLRPFRLAFRRPDRHSRRSSGDAVARGRLSSRRRFPR